jgi:hypothetical protein
MDASPYGASTFSQGGVTNGPLFQFQTPLVKDIPTYLPESRGVQVLLWRHYTPKYRGVNVYVLSDGTVVQDTPTTENANTNIPLPWILNNDPKVQGWYPPIYDEHGHVTYGPFVSWLTGAEDNTYSYVTNWDGSITTTVLDPHIVYIYEGGHAHTINQYEANILSGAGYSGNITPL